MKITEKVIDNPEKERVVLEYVNFTKKFAEIKEYVQKKGEAILGYTAQKECIPVRMEDILYFETMDGSFFAYTKTISTPKRTQNFLQKTHACLLTG